MDDFYLQNKYRNTYINKTNNKKIYTIYRFKSDLTHLFIISIDQSYTNYIAIGIYIYEYVYTCLNLLHDQLISASCPNICIYRDISYNYFLLFLNHDLFL